MADGGLLLFGFCALATLAVLPTAILASAMFGAPPQPQYLVAWRRRSGWGGGTVVMPAPAPGQAYFRLHIPQDGSEYLVVRADTFAGGDGGSAPPPAARAEEREAPPEAAAEAAGDKCE